MHSHTSPAPVSILDALSSTSNPHPSLGPSLCARSRLDSRPDLYSTADEERRHTLLFPTRTAAAVPPRPRLATITLSLSRHASPQLASTRRPSRRPHPDPPLNTPLPAMPRTHPPNAAPSRSPPSTLAYPSPCSHLPLAPAVRLRCSARRAAPQPLHTPCTYSFSSLSLSRLSLSPSLDPSTLLSLSARTRPPGPKQKTCHAARLAVV